MNIGDVRFKSMILIWLAKEKQANFIFHRENHFSFKNQTAPVIKAKLKLKTLARDAARAIANPPVLSGITGPARALPYFCV